MSLKSTFERLGRIRWYSIEWRLKKYFGIEKKDYLNAGERYDPNLAGFYDPCHIKRYELALENVTTSNNVLDIACGTGWGSNMLSNCCSKVVGVDISSEAIKIAKSKYRRRNIKFVKSDFFSFNAKADVIISFETLEHLKAASFNDVLEKLYSFGETLIIGSVPYEELPGNNPHHVSFHLNEKNFTFFQDKGNIEFLYQDAQGEIHKSKNNIKPQNLLFVFKYK